MADLTYYGYIKQGVKNGQLTEEEGQEALLEFRVNKKYSALPSASFVQVLRDNKNKP